MGFFSDIISSAVKVAITPIAVVKDVVDVAIGEEPENTKELLKSAGDDLDSAINEATGG